MFYRSFCRVDLQACSIPYTFAISKYLAYHKDFLGAHANPANPAKGLYESIKDMAEYKKCLYDKIKAVF